MDEQRGVGTSYSTRLHEMDRTTTHERIARKRGSLMTTTAIIAVLRRPALPNMLCHSACYTPKEQRKTDVVHGVLRLGNDVQCMLCGAMIVKGLQWEQGEDDDSNEIGRAHV